MNEVAVGYRPESDTFPPKFDVTSPPENNQLAACSRVFLDKLTAL